MSPVTVGDTHGISNNTVPEDKGHDSSLSLCPDELASLVVQRSGCTWFLAG
jgi:hypothetical protein